MRESVAAKIEAAWCCFRECWASVGWGVQSETRNALRGCGLSMLGCQLYNGNGSTGKRVNLETFMAIRSLFDSSWGQDGRGGVAPTSYVFLNSDVAN